MVVFYQRFQVIQGNLIVVFAGLHAFLWAVSLQKQHKPVAIRLSIQNHIHLNALYFRKNQNPRNDLVLCNIPVTSFALTYSSKFANMKWS